MSFSAESFIAVAVMLLCISIAGLISRRNIVTVYISVELAFNAVNIILVLISRVRTDMDGAVIALLMIGVIAAEAALFLAMIVHLYRLRGSVDTLECDTSAQRGLS